MAASPSSLHSVCGRKSPSFWFRMLPSGVPFLVAGCLTLVSIFWASVSLINGPLEGSSPLSNQLAPQTNLYAVYFDGGSTGTRVHIFSFRNTSNHLHLVSGEYLHIQPGLSSYAKEPHKAAQSLVPLLKEAKRLIPASQWANTPLVLKATAGLRLLPQKSANDILQEIKDLFASSSFSVDSESVSILDGTMEGVFAWQTINFLLEELSDWGKSQSVATLDLGGGSTQLVFQPKSYETLVLSPPSHLLYPSQLDHSQHHPTGELPVYTKSYLGYGLMSARLGILMLTNQEPERTVEGLAILYTPCFHPTSSRFWSYNDTQYLIRGYEQVEDEEEDLFYLCNHLAKMYLGVAIFKPPELAQVDIHALSYYFDRALDAGILDSNDLSGKVKVGDFERAARDVCSRYMSDEMFLCMDLNYISAFLEDGLGLDPAKEIYITKKLAGIEASWVLGAAFHHLTRS